MSVQIEVQQKLPTGVWDIDPAHSQVSFALKYMVGVFSGGFSPVAGSLTFSEDGGAVLHGEAEVKDIKVQDEALYNHLQSPEFFDAERAPKLHFKSNEFQSDGNEAIFKGQLTIRGIALPIELRGQLHKQMTDPFGRERIGLTLRGTVDRIDFGLNWNANLPSGEPALADDVELNAELYFLKG